MMRLDDDGQEYWKPLEIPRRFFDWIDNPLTDNHAAEGSEYFNQALLTDQACWVLQHSPTIQASFEIYEDLTVYNITAEDRDDLLAEHIRQNKTIAVSPSTNVWIRAGLLAHEFGHAVQAQENLLKDAFSSRDRAIILIKEADARVFDVTVSYELRHRFPHVWASDLNKKLKLVLLKSILENPENIVSGVAGRRVFEEYLNSGMGRQFYFNYHSVSKKFANGREKPIAKSSVYEVLAEYYDSLKGMPFSAFNGTEYEQIEREHYLNPNDAERVVRAVQMKL